MIINLLFISVVGISIFLSLKKISFSLKQKNLLFDKRDNQSVEVTIDSYKKIKSNDVDYSIKKLNELSSIMGIPVEKIRMTDRFDNELQDYPLAADQFADIEDWIINESGSLPKASIITVGELIEYLILNRGNGGQEKIDKLRP